MPGRSKRKYLRRKSKPQPRSTLKISVQKCRDAFNQSPAAWKCQLNGNPRIGKMSGQAACVIDAYCYGRETGATYYTCDSLYVQADNTLWVERHCGQDSKLLKNCKASWGKGSAKYSCFDVHISTKHGTQCTISALAITDNPNTVEESTIDFTPCRSVINRNGELVTGQPFNCPYPQTSPSASPLPKPPSPHRFNIAGIVIAGLIGASATFVFWMATIAAACSRPKKHKVSYSRGGKPSLIFADRKAGQAGGSASSANLGQ